MPAKIFFCYAHEDEILLKKLKTHLKPLQRDGLIDIWHDRDINAGAEWQREISEQLNTAQIILLLVSPNFLDSDYCYGNEMKRAMERHELGEARVIPIILRPVHWQLDPLRKLQALPTDAKPVTTWRNRDQAFVDIEHSLRKIIQQLKPSHVSETSEEMIQGSPSSSQPVHQDAYRKFWSRQFRGLLVLLLDQSGSMEQQVEIGGITYTNAQMATASLNALIHSAINTTPIDAVAGDLKDYFDILVLGYGDQVIPLLHDGHGRPISIRELAKHPKGYQRVLVERYDRVKGSFQQIPENRPYWITNTASSYRTEMALAMQQAYQAIQKWLAEDMRHEWSFPPIVINITNGQHNGTGDPVVEAKHIHSLYTNDGNVLLFNCYLASHGQQCIAFPKSRDIILTSITELNEREWATQLFDMSSVLPGRMVIKARDSFGIPLEDGARGFLYNANPSDFMNFLRWGTRPG